MSPDHGVVFADPVLYCGWPANHGAWQWGNEFLVGFLSGAYRRKRMHNIAEPFTKRHARSLDGGETWRAFTLRTSEGDDVDIGYPRLLLRDDGRAVCVYYWASQGRPQQHIARTIFQP